jgi:hypothetical protein
MAVTVQWTSATTVSETVSGGAAFAATATIVHNGLDTKKTLNSTTTPPVSKTVDLEVTLVAGAKTVDLTNMVGTNNATVNGTGLKVQVVKIVNPATNTHPLVLVPGASTGYRLFGSSSKITLYPGEELAWKGYNATAYDVIGSGLKNLDFSDGGAGGTETCDVMLVMG